MRSPSATAIAHPNIAFIKYWGDADSRLRIPANGSISMNLEGLYTRTKVTFEPTLDEDRFTLDGQVVAGEARKRVSKFLDLVRQMSGITDSARVESENNFPSGSGIASSASAFAALSLAASTAAGLKLDEGSLSRLARRGSGSACRSIPAGFVEWQAGEDNASSYAFSIAPPEHWDMNDCIAVVSHEHKETGSSDGHALAGTSVLQSARIADAPRRLDICRQAILQKDFQAFVEIVELDSNLMHAVTMTSKTPLFYWHPETLAVIQAIGEWRRSGIPVCYTIDAGPNVHVLTPGERALWVSASLLQIEGVDKVLSAKPGAGVRLITE